jgi:hypothetical protein
MTNDRPTRTRGLWEDCTSPHDVPAFLDRCDEARDHAPDPPPPGVIPPSTHLSEPWLIRTLIQAYGWCRVGDRTLVRRRR